MILEINSIDSKERFRHIIREMKIYHFQMKIKPNITIRENRIS
jgi:hypothetical protein